MQFLYFPGIVISCSRLLSHVVINIPWLVPWMGDMLSSWRNVIWESLFFVYSFYAQRKMVCNSGPSVLCQNIFLEDIKVHVIMAYISLNCSTHEEFLFFFAIVGSRLNWAEVECLHFFIWPFLANSEKRTNRWWFYIDKSLMTRNMQPKHFRSGFNQARGNSEADSLIVHWIPCILNAWTNCMRCLSIPGWSRDKHVQ